MKLEELEPKKVMEYFKQLCAIPHGSGNVQAVSDFLKKFAQDRNLEVIQDESLNIIIKKAASAGYEGKEPIILQGHMDMVAVAEDGSGIDMKTHPLDLRMDGDWLYADKTSLGGDDGIAVAMCMALLDDDSLAHPPLEVVLTTEEETNMGGASRIDLSSLEGKRLLNLDSEEEGILLCGCAGGGTYYAALPYQTGEVEGISYKLEICGLTGGHSGQMINEGRGNANLMLGRLLYEIGELEGLTFHLKDVSGGKATNVIAPSAVAELVIEKEEDAMLLKETVDRIADKIRNEYRITEPGLFINLTREETGKWSCIDGETTKKLARLICALPNGVQGMSAAVPGLVETSLNLGLVQNEKDHSRLLLQYLIRSSVQSAKEFLFEKLHVIGKAIGADCGISDTYPGWEYQPVSPLRDHMVEVYEKMYGKKMKTEAIHAGLECGFFSEKIPGLDCVSIGPDMKDIHSPKEMLNIPSVKRTWEYVCEALKSR